MRQGQSIFKVRGMQRDLSVSAFNSQYSYENKNIRIMSTDDNTLLSISNEKGNISPYIYGIGDSIKGIPIGQSLLNDELVIFSSGQIIIRKIKDIDASSSTINDLTATERNIEDIDSEDFKDKIYKIWLDGLNIGGKILFSGNLKFNPRYPIETISLYENENSKKVYWVDGINQPRVINIASETEWKDNSFNFVKEVIPPDSVTIDTIDGGGQFSSGVIQYCITYVSEYLQESNIVYTSPLYFTSSGGKGGSPEELSNNSFRINIYNPDTSWDYVRIYSIFRSSINATPEVKRVIDLSIGTSTGGSLTYTDSGNYGDIEDPTKLLYVGGVEAVFGTISHKDGTLFLGDIKVSNNHLWVENNTKADVVFGTERVLDRLPLQKGVYSYKNTLPNPTERIFKYGETYRLGIQFQDKVGNWTNPIFITDIVNNIKPTGGREISTGSGTDKQNVGCFCGIFDNNNILTKYLKEHGYINARPLVVYPKFSERTIIAQGIVCPTVFRASDRYNNAPYAQSSWIFRPFGIGEQGNMGTTTFNSHGYRAEFRHCMHLPPVNYRECEIQNAGLDSLKFVTPFITSNHSNWINNYGDEFFVDHSIFTFHSPDIELGDEFTMDNLYNYRIRVVGIVPISSKYVTRTLSTSSPTLTYTYTGGSSTGYGRYIEGQEISLDSKLDIAQAWYSIGADVLWMDYAVKGDKVVARKGNYSWGYLTYLWHRNGSLNNDNGGGSAKLKSKTEAMLRFSYNTYYLDTPVLVQSSKDFPDMSIWDSNEISAIYVGDKTYYGNIDSIISPVKGETGNYNYPVIVTGSSSDQGIPKEIYRGYARKPEYTNPGSGGSVPVMDTELTGAVSMKYKSPKHLVINLGDIYTDSNNQTNYTQWILPQIKSENGGIINLPYGETQSSPPFWTNISSGNTIFNFRSIEIPDDIGDYFSPGYNISAGGGVMYLCDIIRDNIDETTLFGGMTKDAMLANEWLIAGEDVTLQNISESVGFIVYWNWGDTYYQRYDCLKTYPFDSESQNNVIDVLSFMCETRINLDGRYDDNRGTKNLLNINIDNFNKINKVYSQDNNYFIYRMTDSSTEVREFPNSITWTKTKTNGELTDSWTNITLASVLDLDGDKGKIRALRRFNNELIAFQDRGISNILYNSRTPLSSTDGIPIELANSGKVDGKRYLSDKIGCTNKWSIRETPNGIYFIDDISKGIFLFSGEIANLSDKLGFHSWINSRSTDVNIWNPIDFEGFVTYYDKVNGDVFFISKEECLAFSEPLGQFSSFYSYENTPFFSNIRDRGLFIRPSSEESNYKLWLHNEGDYNMYFDKYQPFYITVIVNENPILDKIFTNIEFRSDSWKSGELINSTFDTLNVWNEYQKGVTKLSNLSSIPSSLKERFRIWRANIPRDCFNHRDRIRNPWIYLKLSRTTENTNRTILHDLIVKYLY